MLGMLIGFGVKLPTVPLHNWLPDAHVEAPTADTQELALNGGIYQIISHGLLTGGDVFRRWHHSRSNGDAGDESA